MENFNESHSLLETKLPRTHVYIEGPFFKNGREGRLYRMKGRKKKLRAGNGHAKKNH